MMKLITPPSPSPLTVADVKTWARIDTDALDAEIGGLISAAMQMAEHECSKFWMTQTWRIDRPNWPAMDEMLRIHDPVSAVVKYKLLVTDPTFITVPAADYVIVPRHQGFALVPTALPFPEIVNDLGDTRVQLEVTVGNNIVPPEVLLYMKTQCAWWIRNPEAVQDGKFMPGPFIAQMLHGEKVWWM